MKNPDRFSAPLLAALWLWNSTAAFSLCYRFSAPRLFSTKLLYRDDKLNGDTSSIESSSSSLTPASLSNAPTRSSSWKQADQLWNEEWHDAFIRCGLIDFTPPMTDHLFCLIVGDGLVDTKEEKQLSKDHPKALNGRAKELPTKRTSSVLLHSDNRCQEPCKLFGDPNNQRRFRYDCILDTSCMNDLAFKEHFGSSNFINSGPTIQALLKNAGALLVEATEALKEHGIYVAITQKSMCSNPILKQYLIDAGHSLGMQWNFDLEEVSGDNVYVSVARIYFTGALPSSHGLAYVDLDSTSNSEDDYLSWYIESSKNDT